MLGIPIDGQIMSLLPSSFESFTDAELQELEDELRSHSHYPGREGDLGAINAEWDNRRPRASRPLGRSRPQLRSRGSA